MRILVSPLDWGLGHATRCIPLIRHLQSKGVEIIIGAEGLSMELLKEEFPEAEYVKIPGYEISYSSWLPASVKVAMQIPQIKNRINKEHDIISGLTDSLKIDAILSDNRYGLWSDKIPSVLITHQLNVLNKAGSIWARKQLHDFINKFNECWIPDFEGENNLSGDLSHPIPKGLNAKYIGPLSRFERVTIEKEIKYDLLILLSGPEPQRSILEDKILHQCQGLNKERIIIVRGLPGGESIKNLPLNIESLSHLPSVQLNETIVKSHVIVARPGYSTIMDLEAIGNRKVIYIPTPGQPEQEYLARISEKNGTAVVMSQNNLSIIKGFSDAKELNPEENEIATRIFKNVIDEWLESL